MITNQAYRKVGTHGKSLGVKITEQLKEIGCVSGSEVHVKVQELDGKKVIVIENK